MQVKSQDSRKRCNKCRDVKPIGDFHVNRRNKDLRSNTCKECAKERSRAWRSKNPGRQNELKRRWASRHRADIALRNASSQYADKRSQYNKLNPEKRAAHFAVRNAVLRGEIKQAPCMVCGDVRSEAHHEDYTKPLDVQWLCRLHHRQRHAKYKLAA